MEESDDRKIVLLEQARVLAPNHVEVLRSLASLLLRKGDPAEALTLCDRALKAGGTDPLLQSDRGIILMALKRWPEALKELERAVQGDAALGPVLADKRAEARRNQP